MKLSIHKAIFLTASCVPLFLIDNVLKLLLLRCGVPVPMLLIFLGAIRGFISFGIIGLFVGAVVLSLGYELFTQWLKSEGVLLMRFTTAIALFLILLFPKISFAQHAGYKLYTIADGLVQSEVTALHQDAKGFLWIGTKNGISRFDGHSFQTIRDTAGISEAWVKCIQTLNDSTVWVITTKGSLVYNYGISSVTINSFLFDNRIAGYWIKDGKGFFVTSSLELFQVDRRGKAQVRDSFFDRIIGMAQENGWTNPTYSKRDGNFYFKTKTGHLACVRQNKVVILHHQSFATLLTGNDDRVYLLSPATANTKSLIKAKMQPLTDYHGEKEEPTRISCISDTMITTVAEFGMNQEILDNQLFILNADTMFFSSPDSPRLRQFTKGNLTTYILPFPAVNAMLIDRERNLWLGSPIGLIRLHSLSFTSFNETDGLCKNIQIVAEDRNRNIIVGGFDQGIQKIKKGCITNIPMPEFSGSGATWNIYPGCMKDRNGNLDISINPYCMITWDGRVLRHIPGLPLIASFSFYEDTLARMILCGTDLGLLKQKESMPGYELLKIFPGNKENKVVSMIMSDKDRLLLGGFKGLSFLERERVTHLPTKEFPYTRGANAMVKDHHGNIWIGNTDGLWMFDKKKFRKVLNPWFNDLVVSLCVIDSSKLFIGGLHGIGFLDMDMFFKKDTAVIRYFNADNGFTGNECQQNAVCLDSRGILWVATTDNLQRIDPGNLPLPMAGPQVFIEKISLLDEKMKMVPLVISSVAKGQVDLCHSEDNLRFDFTALVFRGSSFVRFRSRLEGQDKDWSPPTEERYVVYTNLAPGKYTFKVVACNDDGNWSVSPACFYVNIRPAFWQTWWFWTLIVMVLAGFFFWLGYVVMSRRKRSMQEKLESEKKIAELQLISIRNQIDPHFTFNAMNSIASVILKEEREKAYGFFVKFSNLIRQVLTSSDKITRTLAEELVFVQNYLEIEKLRFRDSFEFIINIVQPVNLDQEVPKMVIQTYAENALKHGLLNKKDGAGMLSITIREKGNKLHIEVVDNGIGRDQARHIRQHTTGKGMMILNFYYDFFDRYNDQKIFHEVTDLYDENHQPAGTRVTVIIPSGFKYSITAHEPT